MISCQSTRTLCLNLTSQQAVPIMSKLCRDLPTAVCRVVKEVKPVERKGYIDTKEKDECKIVQKVKLEKGKEEVSM